MHQFRLDDFDHHFRVGRWDALPPIAAHIRWLKRRLEDVLSPRVTMEEQSQLLQMWNVLVDQESLTWRYGNSPHGWYAKYPDCERLDEECSGARFEDGETIGVASRTGTEVMTVGQWLADREQESVHRLLGGRVESRGLSAPGTAEPDDGDWEDEERDEPLNVASVGDEELVHLLGLIAVYRVEDAELLLLGSGDLSGAWHLLSEAVELVNRAERVKSLRMIGGRLESAAPPTTEPTRGRFYIAEDGSALIEFLGLKFSYKSRNNSKGGLKCIQAILKSPTHGLPSETLALEYIGLPVLDMVSPTRQPNMEPDERARFISKLKEISARRSDLKPDSPGYIEERLSLDEDYDAIEKVLSNNTYAGSPKYTLGPKEKRRRSIDAIIDRSVTSIMKTVPGIGRHFKESLKGLNTERLHYSPSEAVAWEFGPPNSVGENRTTR